MTALAAVLAATPAGLLSASPTYNAFEIVATILGILGLVSGCLVIVRSATTRETIRVLKENNDALKEQVELLKLEKAEQDKQLTQVKAALVVLQNTVSGAAAVEALSRQVGTLRNDLLGAIGELNSTVKGVSR